MASHGVDLRYNPNPEFRIGLRDRDSRSQSGSATTNQKNVVGYGVHDVGAVLSDVCDFPRGGGVVRWVLRVCQPSLH